MIKEELFEKAEAGDYTILNDPNVSIFKDEKGDTPLHILTKKAKIEIIFHPGFDTIEGAHGYTALGYLLFTSRSAGRTKIVYENRGIALIEILGEDKKEIIFYVLKYRGENETEYKTVALAKLDDSIIKNYFYRKNKIKLPETVKEETIVVDNSKIKVTQYDNGSLNYTEIERKKI